MVRVWKGLFMQATQDFRFQVSQGAQAPAMPSRQGWTRHANTRCHQHGIRQDVTDLLLDWGCFEHLQRGIEWVSFRKRDLDRLHKTLPKPQWLAVEKQRKLYAVLDGDTLITIGHRHGHMKRK
jgi:hypothetical protein